MREGEMTGYGKFIWLNTEKKKAWEDDPQVMAETLHHLEESMKDTQRELSLRLLRELPLNELIEHAHLVHQVIDEKCPNQAPCDTKKM